MTSRIRLLRVLRTGSREDRGVRDLSELTAVEDPAWPHLAEMIAGSPVDVQVLPADPAECAATMLQLQVITRSWLGAVTMSTGGLVADHGWLRIYGGSRAPSGLPGLAQVNGFPAQPPRAGSRLQPGHRA